MRIAVITQDWPDFTDGGVATLSLSLARGLVELGSEVEVWTRGGGSRGAAVRARAESGTAHPFAVHAMPGRHWRKKGNRNWSRGLPDRLFCFAPDAVIVTTWEPLEAAQRACEALPTARRPTFAVIAHGRDVTGDPGPDRREQRCRAFDAEVQWLVLSQWMRGELCRRGVDVQRISVVPAAVPDFADLPERARRPPRSLLTVGRLIPRKGQDVVIRAMGMLRTRYPQLRYVVVGDGPDRERLQHLVAEHSLQDRVRLVGRLGAEQLEGALQDADLFVMPAREESGGDTEGYGLVFLEAGARGLPVVGGRSGGVPAAVVSGENGELVDRPQEPEAVAQVLGSLLSDAGRMARLGAGGRKRYELTGRPAHLARGVRDALGPMSGGA